MRTGRNEGKTERTGLCLEQSKYEKDEKCREENRNTNVVSARICQCNDI